MLSLMLFGLLARAQAAPPSPGPLSHDRLEELYTRGDFDQGLAEARAMLLASPADVDLHWHVARLMYEIGERVQRDQASYDKEAWYAEMLAVCERGLALSPDHPHLLFGKGIALGRLATTRGIVASIRTASEIERSWTLAARSTYVYRSRGDEEILPCDPIMALGTFYRMVPDLLVVKVLTGTRGDLDRAISLLAEADACSPNRIEIGKELGVALVCAGQRRKQDSVLLSGLTRLRAVAASTPTKPTDHIDIRHAAMVAADPDLACAYSRDGQAEVDARQLNATGVRAAP